MMAPSLSKSFFLGELGSPLPPPFFPHMPPRPPFHCIHLRSLFFISLTMVDTNGNRYAQAAQKHWRMKHGLDDVPVLHPSEAIQSPLDTPLQNLQLREPPTSADLGRLESPPPPPSSAKGRLKLGAFPGAGGESAAGASERGGEERRAAEAGEEGGEEHHPVSSTKDTSIQMRLPMLTPRSSPLTCDACYDKATWFEPSKADGDFTDEQVDYPQVTATPICSESADVVQTSILLLRFSFCVWRRCLLFPGDLRRPVLTHRMVLPGRCRGRYADLA